MVNFGEKMNILKHASRKTLISKEKDANNKELLKEAILGESKLQMILALLKVVKNILPNEINEMIIKKIPEAHSGNLPFNPDKLSFKKESIGEGYISEVFLLESLEKTIPSFVLKSEYKSHGSSEELKDIALRNKREYEEIKEMYGDMPDLIPKEYHIIGTSPVSQRPSVLTVQEFLGTDLEDIFKMEKGDLLEAFREDPDLKIYFVEFTKKSMELWRSEGKIIDFAGEANLVLAKNGNNRKLIFLDPHNISINGSSDIVRRKILEERLRYLNEIVLEVEKDSEMPIAA